MPTYMELVDINEHLSAFLRSIQALPKEAWLSGDDGKLVKEAAEMWRKSVPSSPIFFIIEK